MSNPLINILTPKVRAIIYALASLASLIWGIYQAQDEDWRSTVAAVLALLITLTAASNASATPDPNPNLPGGGGGEGGESVVGLLVTVLVVILLVWLIFALTPLGGR